MFKVLPNLQHQSLEMNKNNFMSEISYIIMYLKTMFAMLSVSIILIHLTKVMIIGYFVTVTLLETSIIIMFISVLLD